MKPVFSVSTPATSLALLTPEELRAAAGVTGAGSDVALAAIGAAAAADIMTECNIASDGVNPPTLMSEPVIDTFRPERPFYHNERNPSALILSRRFVSSVTSVVEAGVELTADDYLLRAEAGLLERLINDNVACWQSVKVVVAYVAGFATVPPELKAAAAELVRTRWSETSRDPLVKGYREKVDDIRETETTYWVGGTSGADKGPVPANVAARLARFMNIGVG